MLKFLPLLIKFAPILWAFIKEVVFKREDKRYLIRNKFQVLITVLIMLYTPMLYVLHEGYNAHAKESLRKSNEIVELLEVVKRKTKLNKDLLNKQCPINPNTAMVEMLMDEKFMHGLETKYKIPLAQN